jgi:hypothetical protein
MSNACKIVGQLLKYKLEGHALNLHNGETWMLWLLLSQYEKVIAHSEVSMMTCKRLGVVVLNLDS